MKNEKQLTVKQREERAVKLRERLKDETAKRIRRSEKAEQGE